METLQIIDPPKQLQIDAVILSTLAKDAPSHVIDAVVLESPNDLMHAIELISKEGYKVDLELLSQVGGEARQVSKEKLDQLQKHFPNLDKDTLQASLDAFDGNVDKTRRYLYQIFPQ